MKRKLLTLGLTLSALSLHAEDLVVFDFLTDLSVSSTGTTVSVDGLNFNNLSEFGRSTSTNFGSDTGHLFVRANVVRDDIATAFTDNSYFSFTVTPDASTTVSLTQLSFQFDYLTRNDTDIASIAVTSSVNGHTQGAIIDSFTIPETDNYQTLTVALSEAEYQNVGTPIEFRFYLADTNVFSGDTLRFDDIVLTGSSTIPEPGAYALLSGLLAMGVIVTQRKLRR